MTPSDKIDLVKWFLGSFVIVVITTIISYQFQDREHGLNEMNQYDKYVTELIVLNKDLGKRRLLAQYFAYVTPSDKLKEPWMDYYLLLDKEYKQLQIQDSLITIQLSKSSDTTSNNHVYLLEKQQEIKQKLNDDLVMPNIINNKSDEAAKFERLGFESVINGDNKSAINYFEKCELVYPSYHSSYEIIKYLRENINSDKKSICKGLLKYTWKVPKDITEQLK
jgi:hypothetical protein